MRRTLGLVLLVGFVGTVIGCFTSGSKPESGANAGPPTGDKEHTLEYWGKVREVMRKQSTLSDMQKLATVIRGQVDAVRRLPVDGVDRDLLVATFAVVQSQEKLLTAAETAGYNPTALRSDASLQKSFTDAGQQITSGKVRLKALHTTLSARYGVTFLPIDDAKQ